MRGRRIVLIAAAALVVGVLTVAGVGTALALGPFGGMMGGYGQAGPGGTMAGWNGGGGGSGGCAGTGSGGMMGGWYGQNQEGQGQPISLDQAVKNVQAYVDNTGNKDLAVDEVMEFQYNFYAIVKEKSTGTGAFEVLVNKYTGAVYPEPGPNMMWNTKYGMMAGGARGMMGGRWGWSGQGQSAPAGQMTVTPEQAKAAAQKWLDQNQPGSTTESPDQFYGYYTVHTLKDGKVTGMLSVDGYSGQVWYHTWHGSFVQVKELTQ